MAIDSQLDTYLRAYVEQWQIVGLAAAIVEQGTLRFSAAYGVQDRPSGQPVTVNTLFHIASVAKTMTSTAIMQLREQGKLNLDDPVVKHLPYFRVADPRSDTITIRQCLCHTSGIGHPTDYGWDQPEFDDEALERHVRGLATHQLLDLAPNAVSYSDIAYNVLGDLIAKVSGMSYEQYMKTRLFDPLGMTTTTLMAPRAAHPERVATGYEKREDGTIVQSFYPYNRSMCPVAVLRAVLSKWRAGHRPASTGANWMACVSCHRKVMQRCGRGNSVTRTKALQKTQHWAGGSAGATVSASCSTTVVMTAFSATYGSGQKVALAL